MAAGDAYAVAPTSTATGSFLDLQPGGSVEVVVHNVYVPTGTAYELYWYDGTNSILFLSMPAGGAALNLQCHCVGTTKYVRIKNVSGATAYLGADGMTTK